MTAADTFKKAQFSCTKCGHLPVCIIFRTFTQGHKQVFPEGTDAAFQPEDLANICCQFYSKTIMNLSTNNEEDEEEKE
jgi:hypothetical protein